MATAKFQRSVRPRVETEDVEALSMDSRLEEAMSTSGDEDGDTNIRSSNGKESEAEPENRDEDVRFCRRLLL